MKCFYSVLEIKRLCNVHHQSGGKRLDTYYTVPDGWCWTDRLEPQKELRWAPLCLPGSDSMWSKDFAIIRVNFYATGKKSPLNISVGFNSKIRLDMWNLPCWKKWLKNDSFLHSPPAAWFFVILICERKNFFQVIVPGRAVNKMWTFQHSVSIECINPTILVI